MRSELVQQRGAEEKYGVYTPGHSFSVVANWLRRASRYWQGIYIPVQFGLCNVDVDHTAIQYLTQSCTY